MRKIIALLFICFSASSADAQHSDSANIITTKDSIRTLEEVIVSTGYQQTPRERATGSFVQVDNKLLNRNTSANILDRIKGVTSGVLFGEENTDITIRGKSTIFSNTHPLIILDNFPYDGSINNINPNDIDNVTILKDAAAASIWGARAGNGVIVITTKKGIRNHPLKVQINMNNSTGSKPDLYKVPVMSPASFIEMQKTLFNAGAYNNSINNTFSYPALSPAVEILLKGRRNQLTEEQVDEQLQVLANNDIRADYMKYVYHHPFVQQYAINMSGGSDKNTWLFSAGYDRNKGTLKADDQRITLRSDNSFYLSKKLLLNAGMIYTNGRTYDGKNAGYSSNAQYPYEQLANNAGAPLAVTYFLRDSFAIAAEQNGLLNWQYIPLQNFTGSINRTNLSDIRINTGISYSLFPWLSAELKYQLEEQQIKSFKQQGLNEYYTRDLINRFTQLDNDGNITGYIIPKGAILDQELNQLYSHTGRLQINVNKEWHKYRLNAVLGTEIRQFNTTGNKSRLYGYNPQTLGFTQVDYSNPYIINPGGYPDRIPDNTTINNFLDRYRSYFANAAFSILETYVLSASVRKDASNYFGLATNQRTVPLWSAGGRWNINREKFYNSRILPALSIRMTYGFNGNVNKELTAYATAYNATGSWLTNSNYAIFISPGNSSLRWEKTGMLNIAADFSLINNIISGSIEYFHKKGIDLIGNVPIDPTLGILQGGETPSYTGNFANMTGRGIDISLTSMNINKSLVWTTTYLFSSAKDKITKYNMGALSSFDLLAAKTTVTPVEGKPLYAVYSYKWAGLDPSTGDPMGYDVEGKPSKNYTDIVNAPIEQLEYKGSSKPTIFGSLRNSFSFKGLSLSFNLTYKMGYYFQRSSISYSGLVTAKNGHSDFERRWKQPGDEKSTFVPSFIYPSSSLRTLFYNSSSILIERADHIRLQDISISYSFTEPGKRKMLLNGAEVYLYASNLGIVWRANKENLDPDYLITPAAASITAGLRFNF